MASQLSNSLTFRVLLLVFFSAAHAQTQCPQSCTCNSVTEAVECRGMFSLTVNMFPAGTKSIKFSHSSINEIPADMFSGYANLKKIEIFQCNIPTGAFRTNAFRNLHDMDYIKISASRVSTIEDGVFSNLRNIKEISLIGVSSDTISSRMFDNIDGIQLFKISRCTFREVKERAFNNIRNVDEFIFELNTRDLHVSKNAFTDLVSIGTIKICPTKFRSINARSFSNIRVLNTFEFCKNRLGLVPAETFWDVIAKDILFRSNQFNDLQPGTIDSLIVANPNAVRMIDNSFRCNCSINWMVTDKRDVMMPYLGSSPCIGKTNVTLADVGNCGVITTTTTTATTTKGTVTTTLAAATTIKGSVTTTPAGATTTKKLTTISSETQASNAPSSLRVGQATFIAIVISLILLAI